MYVFRAKPMPLLKSQVASPRLKRVTATLTTKAHTQRHTHTNTGKGGGTRERESETETENGKEKKVPCLEDGYFYRASSVEF